MKLRKIFRISNLAIGGLMIGFLATSLTGNPVIWMQSALLGSLGVNPSTVQAGPIEERELGGNSFQVAKGIRPAAKGESPEDAQLKNLVPPVPPGQLRRPSKMELLDKCARSPRCQAKLKKAQQRGPNKPLPAAREESPEDQELKSLPKALPPRGPHQPAGRNILMPEEGQSLLSWLNPFYTDNAYAQGGVSIHLVPGGAVTSSSYMYLFGARVYPDNSFRLFATDPWEGATTENHTFAYLKFYVPAIGTYLVNVRANKGKAKLRHQYNGPIIADWDFTAQSYGTYDYLTAEFLEQGLHYFYFWPDDFTSFSLYSASLESYP